MSYDLTFWKQKSTCTMPPSHIYRELLDGRAVESLETIPTADFVARIHQKFPGITTDGGLTFWEGGKRGMFGTVPYGWSAVAVERMSKTGRRGEDLIRNPLEYQILEKITIGEWKALSCNEVARRLNAIGIPAKHGGRWYGASVSSVRQHAIICHS